jgi:hypothetical protein
LLLPPLLLLIIPYLYIQSTKKLKEILQWLALKTCQNHMVLK